MSEAGATVMPAVMWLTGAQGFVGQHLTGMLRAAGHRVVGFSRPSISVPSKAAEVPILPLSPDGLTAAVERFGPPTRVYHLAGGSTVGRSISNPHEDFLANVCSTETLLEALRTLGRPVPLVLASSAAVYGQGYHEPISISARPAPSSPYGHHKLMAEQLVRAHAETYGLPAIICRLFSIYGPGLRKQLLFDACTRLAAAPAGTGLSLGGTGEERRDWLHVADAVTGMAGVSDPKPGQVLCYNLATGRPTTIREIATELVQAWSDERQVTFSGISRNGDPFSLVADRRSLPPEFLPSISLGEGLADFVAWFRGTGAVVQ